MPAFYIKKKNKRNWDISIFILFLWNTLVMLQPSKIDPQNLPSLRDGYKRWVQQTSHK